MGLVTQPASELAKRFIARWSSGGTLAAALAADAPVAAIRHPLTANSDLYIERLDIGSLYWITALTAAQRVGFYLQRFDSAALAGGTVRVPLDLRAEGDSYAGDVRSSDTAALTTAGVSFKAGTVPVIDTWTVGAANQRDAGRFLDLRETPIILNPGQGIALRNLVVWPAAGTAVLDASITFSERDR
jgi:hypothetical protein